MMTPLQVAEIITRALDDKMARDIKVLYTENVTVLADYFVICTATSPTHIKTLIDETEKRMTEAGEPPLRREGYRNGGWMLLDFGCVIAHLFLSDVREFYSLERLWADAPEIELSSLLNA